MEWEQTVFPSSAPKSLPFQQNTWNLIKISELYWNLAEIHKTLDFSILKNLRNFCISGGNLPLQKVWISLGFQRSGPICRGPLRAASGFFAFLLKLTGFHDLYVKCEIPLNFMKVNDFHGFCGFYGICTSESPIFLQEYLCFVIC